MKFKIFTIALALGMIMPSCSDEDKLTPSGDYSVVRFEFPQGNNDFDKELEAIHDEYGIYVIYKDITVQDLNRKWTSVGTDNTYYGNDVPASDMPFYVDFLKNRVFKYMDKKDVDAVFPVKVYLMENFRALPYGMEDNEDRDNQSSADSYGDIISRYFQPMKTNGFDYWTISFKKSEIEGRNPEGPKRVAAVIFYSALENAIRSGKYAEPANFRDGIDFETKLVDSKYTRDENCPLNRGIPIYITEHFGTQNSQFEIEGSYYISEYRKDGTRDLFFEYIRQALYYTPEEFVKKYPERYYPLLNEKYNMVVDYFLSKGVDLAAMAGGK